MKWKRRCWSLSLSAVGTHLGFSLAGRFVGPGLESPCELCCRQGRWWHIATHGLTGSLAWLLLFRNAKDQVSFLPSMLNRPWWPVSAAEDTTEFLG